MASSVALMHSTRRLGAVGESLALEYLEQAGMTVLDSNWRAPEEIRGELDLVMRDEDWVVVVEVKTSRVAPEIAYQRITPDKRFQLRRLTSLWRRTHLSEHGPTRGDVVFVYIHYLPDGPVADITHLRGAW